MGAFLSGLVQGGATTGLAREKAGNPACSRTQEESARAHGQHPRCQHGCNHVRQPVTNEEGRQGQAHGPYQDAQKGRR